VQVARHLSSSASPSPFSGGAAGYRRYVSQAGPATFSVVVLGSARVIVSLLSLQLARGGS
jgi:hypothetical protein